MNQYAERSDILIVIDSSANPRQAAWAFTSNWTRIIVIHAETDTRVLRVALHEIAHTWGAVSGPGTAGGHWLDCRPQKGPLMCPDAGDAETFSEAELAQMGLP